jgi:hypothetical protein
MLACSGSHQSNILFAPPLQRPPLQNGESENVLEINVQQIQPSNVEVVETINLVGRPSRTALGTDQNMPDVSSSTAATSKSCPVERAEQKLSNSVGKLDQDAVAISQVDCSDSEESSGLRSAQMSRSPGGSITVIEMPKRTTKCNGEGENDQQDKISLVIDLSPQQKKRG